MKSISTILVTTMLILSGTVNANWMVNEESEVTYLSTKVFAKSAGSVTELNTISGVSGEISADGKASIVLDLTTLETNIGIRNERVQSYVFGIDTFSPKATISAEIANIDNIENAAKMTIPAMFSIAGQAKDIELHVIVVKGKDTINVVSYMPTVIKGGDYKMAEGFAKLAELAGLGFIPMDIPVSFNVSFSKG